MGRKAKPAPANSGKALQLCGDTSRLGVSAADVFAQFGAPAFDQAGPEEAAGKGSVPKIEDAEISLALHALQKKDTTTRLRGVGELRDLLQSRPTEALKEACGPFLHLYRRLWVQDSEARVREGLQRCLHCLVESLQRDFGKHLRGAFPTWLCAMFDTHTEVAQAARRAFASSFTSDDKRRGVFRHCQAQCLSLVVANLRHSEQSLHDELGITTTASDRNAALERQDRYIRVIAASLQGLGELVHVCADDPSVGSTAAAPLTAEDIDPFFTTGSPSALWPRLAAKQPPLVRRAATECLVRVLQSNLSLTDGIARSARSAVMNSLVDEAVPPVTAASLLCAFAKAGGAECWDGLDAGKALWPQLLTALNRGGAWDAQFLATLPALLGSIPPASWRSARTEEILRSLLEGGSSKPQAPHGQIWCSFFGVVHAADSAGHPVSDVWRWAPVKLYLGSFSCGNDLPALALPSAAMSALPGSLDKQLPGLLGREGAGKELLAELTKCAPPHTAQSANEDLAQAWAKWLTLLTLLLGEQGGSAVELQDAATEALASTARKLFTAAVQWPTGKAATSSVAEFLPLLDALGHVLSVESVTLQSSWGAPIEEVGHCFAELSSEGLPPGALEELSQGPAEVRLLLWPLLPWWRAAVLADTVSSGAAAAIGKRVLLPLLRRVVRRLQATESRLVPAVRDVVVPVLLHPHGTAKEEVALHLSVGLQLALDCLPEELRAAESQSFCDAVVHLTELVAAGVATAESTLKLALHPRAVKPEDASRCLQKLVAAAEPAEAEEAGARAFQLGVLCASVLASYGSAAGGDGAFAPFRQTLSSILLRSLVQCHSDTLAESELSAWEALQHVLVGVDAKDISGALGSPVASTVCLKRWLRAVREASSAARAPLSVLLVECRGGLGGLRKRGAIALVELWRSAWVTAELSRGRGADLSTSAGAEPFISPNLVELDGSIAALLWELLLASSVVRRENSTLDAALWDWLQAAPAEIRGQFLRFCVKEAWEEGSTWWLADQAEASCQYGPHALSALRRLIGVVWPDAAAAQQAAGLELVAWALDKAAEEECKSPGSAQVVAAVLERSVVVGAPFVMEKTSHSRSQWLAIVRNAAASRTLTSALLQSAAAVERWGKSEAVSGGDAELMDVHEQTLRWAQNAKATLDAGSAFAEYTASVWSSLTNTGTGVTISSQLVIRMQRFISELLQQGKKEQQTFALPGIFRLADELCQASLLPERSWSEILPAVVEVDTVVRQCEEMAEVQNEELLLREPLLPHGMVEDAMEAAVALLRHVPDTVIQRLVPLLSAGDERLQAAAANRLMRGHAAWLPLGPGAVPPGGAAAEVLQQMDELLQDNLEGAKAPPPPAAAGAALDSETAATVNDVAFAVLDAVLGQELSLQLWAVEDSLAAFLEWDVGAESESDSGEPESGSESKSGGGGDGGAQHSFAAHERGVQAETNELPADCRRCCVATLAAWELLLTAVHRHQTTSVPESDKSSSSSGPATGSGGTSAAPTQPTELVATALQLVPDQLSRYQGTYTWRTGVAPPIEESLSPLQPLLRLLCHILTNERLITSTNLEELLRKGLAQCSLSIEEAAEEEPAKPPWDIVSTAGRVLLLALRAVPGAVRGFWEKLPRRRDRNLVEGLVTRNFTPLLLQAEGAFASAQLQAQKDRLPGIEASVCRRPKQLVLQLSRDEFKAELLMQLPDSFPLRTATAEHPDRMPGIPQPRVRNWMLQARQELAGSRPNGVGRVVLMWARSFALFFEGVEDCPICFNVVHLSTQTLPRKSCPTCKNKFHNECLYQWFKSSAKTTCPLCTQPF